MFCRGLYLSLAMVTLVGATPALRSPQQNLSAVATLDLAQGFKIDRARVARDLGELTREPHIFGSKRQRELAVWLQKALRRDGLKAELEEFTAEVPAAVEPSSIGVGLLTEQHKGQNLIATLNAPASKAPSCVIALGSHYDTKRLSHGNYVGANDSGSSTVLLLQIMAYLQHAKSSSRLPCGFVAWFFDGEEALLPNWFDGQYLHPARIVDHTYGSRHAAGRLESCGAQAKEKLCLERTPLWRPGKGPGPQLVGLILLDMVGTPNLKLSRDLTSTPSLLQLAINAARQLGRPDLFDSAPGQIEDDHTAFLARGVPAINLIDFSHLQHWHQPSDTAATLSADSLEEAGRLALLMAAQVASQMASSN